MITRDPLRGPAAKGVALLLAVALGACASSPPVEDASPGDDRLERTNRVAHIAFQQGRYASALTLYRRVEDLAYERDDADAAVDAQYNAAVCLVRLDRVDEADALLQRTRAELQRAGSTEPLEVRLLEATVLYRQQRYGQARALTGAIISEAPESQAARRAQFLDGLIAAAEGDAVRLQAAIEDLEAVSDDRLQADRLELTGHLARLEKRYDDALTAFEETARVRSAGFDYRGTVRALASAGEAAEAARRPSQASVHYLRAGRSALQQGAHERAQTLLARARTLAEQAGDAETAREAQNFLMELEESGGTSPSDS